MAFARSDTGPSGLSINTGTANLFNPTSQQPVAAGLLFSSSQPQQPAGLLGNTSTTTAGSSTLGAQKTAMFGAGAQVATPATTAAGGGGLFGTSAATAQLPPGEGVMLGNSTSSSQPIAGRGLFGASQPAPTSTQPAQTRGLFETASSVQNQNQSHSTGGLFGTSTANTNAGIMFGLPAAATRSSLFGPPALSQQPTTVVSGVRIDASNLRSTTRFNDLHEDLQKAISTIDTNIQSHVKTKHEVDAFLPGHASQIYQIPCDVAFISRKSEGAQAALSSDVTAIKSLRELVKRDADRARLSFKIIDNLKLPSQYHQAGLWPSSTEGKAGPDNADLVGYFSSAADELEQTMVHFQGSLGEIETHLHGVHASLLEQMERVAARSQGGEGEMQGAAADQRLLELAGVLREFEEGILKVAGAVGGVREGLAGLQLRDFIGGSSAL